MKKLPKERTRTTAVSIEAGRRALDAAITPQEIHDIFKKAKIARQLAKV